MRTICVLVCFAATVSAETRRRPQAAAEPAIGAEVSIIRHLQDGEEFDASLADLLKYGRRLFEANWTAQEGGGRPLSKGTGNPLSDASAPLVFPRNFNRISSPEANSCAGCHNAPFGIPGGSGDFVTNVFVLGQRFDFVTFDSTDAQATRGAADEQGRPITLQTVANSRATPGMFGSGYIEMLARQITADLRLIRDSLQPGQSKALTSKGISFGVIARRSDGAWDTAQVEGLTAASTASSGSSDPPSLIIRPFHQASNVVSIRQFTVNAFNHHHGMQATERFGIDTDPDGDGVVNELTRADITASTLYQVALAAPGRVIPNNAAIEAAVLRGENLFSTVRCTACHIPALPLDNQGWIFSEPNPYNPEGNLRVGDAQTLKVDLTGDDLPGPRLKPASGVLMVPMFSDLKLHNICSGADDPNAEALDMNSAAGSAIFFSGNPRFLTRRLWGTANQPNHFHHGKFTTLREAILAHSGEALASRQAFEGLSSYEQGAVIEFLKSLQVLPPGSTALIVDENGKPKQWPPKQ